MRRLLLFAACAGCLDFSILATPPDGATDGGADAASPADAAGGGPDIAGCTGPTGGPSECDRPSDCPGGPAYTCVSGAQAAGLCLLDCTTDSDCGCPGSLCVGSDNGGSFCFRLCDLVANTGCPKSTTCDLATTKDGRAFTICRDDGTVATGGDCTAPLDCVGGNHCFAPSGGIANYYCARWCRVKADCPMGMGCVILNPPVKIAGVSYGACQ